ncbi:glycosyltransferase family 4 protein [Ensifer sp.]|uniref:glycosyltransferase family 4 protein n=1 Tax=Ensifer sp. TaxID=1872086 RepID=UPI00289D992E|nr:glycosyltransferase family 4 protein [Ensifer sp.]
MKRVRILTVYQFATLGGVERALLNRALALKATGAQVTLDLLFLRDHGGLAAIKKAIDSYGLHDYARVVTNPRLADYEFFSLIDTPEFFEFVPKRSKLFAECHASGYQAQVYLRTLPVHVRAVGVPSLSVQRRVSELVNVPVEILPNRVPQPRSALGNGRWGMPVIFYIGRVEPGKNVSEALRIHALAKNIEPEISMLIITPSRDCSSVYDEASHLGTLKNVFIRGAVPFDEFDELYSEIGSQRSVFVSSSRHETWGLSAAESIAAGIPVVLAANEGHREVARENEAFLYPLGDEEAAAGKVLTALNRSERIMEDLSDLRDYHTRLADVTSATISFFGL